MQESINQPQGETPSPDLGNGGTLLTGAALLGGAALLAATPKAAHAQNTVITFASIPGTGDIKVLNYALALEALEANLYVQALAKLSTLGVGASDPLVKYLTEFGKVEAQHRDFLITTIKAANNNTTILDSTLKGATFNFGTNLDSATSILDFLIAVEDTGVQAYIGAVPYFTPRSSYLPVAAAIQGTEARHTAALIAIKNLTQGTSLTTAPTPAENGGTGRDGIIREGPHTGTVGTPDNVLAGVSPYIVFPAA